jgi:succinate dehydrogenase / fumarate reductase iron-sulfur subunit
MSVAKPSTIELKIKRQDAPGAPSRWEEFSLPYRSDMNVISCLMEIQRNPVTKQGSRTTPVVWDCSCLEEVCGACTMRVNGKVCQSCTALIDQLEQPVRLEPMTKFPLIRDLSVDRQRMFDNLIRIKAWVPIDGTYPLGPGPRLSAVEQQVAYPYSQCMTCGCCMEACPQFNDRSDFIGPAPIGQVRLFNLNPTGRLNAEERIHSVMGPGGITECGNAQNCVEVCPKNIPLTDAIGEVGRQATAQMFKDLFG